MSKVNVDEIQVGDLVELTFGSNCGIPNVLGYVIEVNEENLRAIWSDDFKEASDNFDAIVGHWKVINFEEETKVEDFIDKELDELKVYTGKETLQALLEGKTLKTGTIEYKLTEGGLQVDYLNGKGWETSYTDFNNVFLVHEFTEVVIPQVGDWVKTCGYIGRITKVDETYMYAYWSNIPHMETPIFLKHDWEILSPEQIAEYKREQVFTKVGRKLNEFREGDIVMVDNEGVIGVVVSKVNTDEIKVNEFNKLQGWNAKPHQLTPIAFAENQVDLS